MGRARDRFVAITGAIVIATVLMGLLVVQSRSGPHDLALAPTPVPVTVRGAFETTEGSGTMVPGGACVPDPGETACAAGQTRLGLDVHGLPPLGAGGRYDVFLLGATHTLRVGPLVADGDVWSLRSTQDHDGRTYTDLVVALATAVTAAPSDGLTVYHRSLDGSVGSLVDLSDDTTFAVDGAHGSVHLNQIGAVSVSAVAEAELRGPSQQAGWLYRAWLIANGDAGATDLGTFEPVDATLAMLDARVERVDLGQQARFVVYAQPAETPVGEGPAGFPVVDALVPAG